MTDIVTITESAKTKVMSAFEEPEKLHDIDTLIDYKDFKIVIDQKSIIYLKGMELDFDGTIPGKGFVFKNPLATSTCGCGESFSVT